MGIIDLTHLSIENAVYFQRNQQTGRSHNTRLVTGVRR